MKKSLFDVLQKQANLVGWTLRKRYDGYSLGSNPYGGGFLCENLLSVAEQIASQFENEMRDKDITIKKLMDEHTYDDDELEGK